MNKPKLDLDSSFARPKARSDRGVAGSAGADLPADLRRALLAVYELGANDRPADAGGVARRLGVSPSDAARALLALDALGLVWAERCRLTLAGLSVAARLAAARAGARRSAA